MTFSAEQAHVSTSERLCAPIRQAYCESLLPKSPTDPRNQEPCVACRFTHGVGADQMEPASVLSTASRRLSMLDHEPYQASDQIQKEVPDESYGLTSSTRVSDAGFRDEICGRVLTASRNHPLNSHTVQSALRAPTATNSLPTAQPAVVFEGISVETGTSNQRNGTRLERASPVLNDYHESEPLPLCCLFGGGGPCCHCQTQCFPSKSAPNPCNSCAVRILPPSCFSCCLPSPICGWRWGRWRRRRIPNENLLVLSVIQLLCGFAAIILSSVALTKAVFLYQMATGMWAGFLMLITGTQGLIASRRPIMCTLTGLLTLCVVVTIAACLLICVSVAGTIEDGFLDHMNTRSRSQHQTIKFTYSFHPSQTGLQNSDQFYSFAYQGHPENRTVGRLSWSAVKQLYSDKAASHFLNPTPDTHLRTCQVILHVLLLLVGILESSVSLSTCVLCCRYVCSRSGRLGSGQSSFSTRTNIVSLNAATANQAATVLRSGELNQFIGSGNVLLAVTAGSPVDPNDPHDSFDILRHNPPGLEPCVHPSVTPFLPQLNRPALILTQAGTGAMAWTAARAAATLIDRDLTNNSHPSETATASPAVVQSTSIESADIPRNRSRRRWRFWPYRTGRRTTRGCRSDRPQLLFTSLSTLNSRAASTATATRNGSQPLNSSSSPTGLPPCPPGSTLLYVMPSPSSESPPMIFPPFPPIYSPLQKRPSTLNTSRRSTHSDRRAGHSHRAGASLSSSTPSGATRLRGPRSSDPVRTDRHTTLHYLSQLFTRHRGPSGRSDTRSRSASNVTSTGSRSRRHSPSRASASALICAGGNRLLQPVLIIEDPDIFQLASSEPPAYSTIDRHSNSNAPDHED